MVDIMHDMNSACEGRGEQLVTYMYGEDDPGARAEPELPLARCSRCRQAMSGLAAVRGGLAEWTPPRLGDSVLAKRVRASHPGQAWRSLKAVPRWMQAIAALLALGVAGAVANVEVRSGEDGIVVRTGWRPIGAAPSPVRVDAAQTAAALMPVVRSDLEAAKPWRTDLAALGEGLRQELRQSGRHGPVDEAAILRRVREIVEVSEARQRRELALRIAEVIQEGQAQRRIDLQRIDRSLGVLESNSRLHQLRYNEAISNLAVRVGLSGRE